MAVKREIHHLQHEKSRERRELDRRLDLIKKKRIIEREEASRNQTMDLEVSLD